MTTLTKKLLQTIIGTEQEIEFMFNKLSFLEKLTNKYDSISFDERLRKIVFDADEISFEGLIYETYKHIGELAINYLLCNDEWFQEYGISNHDVIEKYNIPALNGTYTTYDSILGEFNLENIRKNDILKFEQEIRKDFELEKVNTKSMLDSWMDNSCCPVCKSNDYEESLEFTNTTEFFKHFDCDCGATWSERYNLTKAIFEDIEEDIASEKEEKLTYQNRQMESFLQSLGLSKDEITNLVLNEDTTQQAKALKKVKSLFQIKVNSTLAQEILDLLNGNLFSSDTSFTHDSDKMKIYIELGNDTNNEEFKNDYEKLKQLLNISSLEDFMVVDY